MNVFTFSGNLGNDCRLGNAGGTPVCNFSVAVKAGFGQNEQSIWIDCALWGKRAEGGLPGYLLKGQKVMVSGELGTREHEGKTYLTCRVNEIDLAGGKNEGGQAGQGAGQGGQGMGQQQGGYAPQQQPMNQQQPNPQQWQGQQQGYQAPQQPQQQQTTVDDLDIPF